MLEITKHFETALRGFFYVNINIQLSICLKRTNPARPDAPGDLGVTATTTTRGNGTITCVTDKMGFKAIATDGTVIITGNPVYICTLIRLILKK